MNTRANDAEIDVPGNGEAGAGALAERQVKTGRERFAREYVRGSLGLAPPAARATLARKVGEGGAVGTQLSKPAEASVRDRRSPAPTPTPMRSL